MAAATRSAGRGRRVFVPALLGSVVCLGCGKTKPEPRERRLLGRQTNENEGRPQGKEGTAIGRVSGRKQSHKERKETGKRPDLFIRELARLAWSTPWEGE